jgi:hypothetical protein
MVYDDKRKGGICHNNISFFKKLYAIVTSKVTSRIINLIFVFDNRIPINFRNFTSINIKIVTT